MLGERNYMPNRYIIDTSSLIQFPQILAHSGNRKIVIPRVVNEELSFQRRNSEKQPWAELITSAKVTVIAPPDTLKQEPVPSDKNARRLSSGDFEIVRTAIMYTEQQGAESPCVVTEDNALKHFLKMRGIESISGSEFLKTNKRNVTNKVIHDAAKDVVSKQRKQLLVSFSFGVLSTIIGSLVYKYFDVLVTTISVWGTIICLPIIGVFLFRYRERDRLSYGIFEFIVGFLIACHVLFPSFDYSQLHLPEGIKIIGGLYVMVRGLDNIGKGVIGTRLESRWRKLFYKNA